MVGPGGLVTRLREGMHGASWTDSPCRRRELAEPQVLSSTTAAAAAVAAAGVVAVEPSLAAPGEPARRLWGAPAISGVDTATSWEAGPNLLDNPWEQHDPFEQQQIWQA